MEPQRSPSATRTRDTCGAAERARGAPAIRSRRACTRGEPRRVTRRTTAPPPAAFSTEHAWEGRGGERVRVFPSPDFSCYLSRRLRLHPPSQAAPEPSRAPLSQARAEPRVLRWAAPFSYRATRVRTWAAAHKEYGAR
ncbi:hypothetical protein PVAP13_7NG287424 [Panicum virgatum]|uniref:Uncharacterized protein n=1 Tax=Panicum virgatum TaxID=38727 RepID=A0A8T0Q1N4_PANVG|nr:hypothetical protein PVAP13_7NG287424 [Panicum virgatum]